MLRSDVYFFYMYCSILKFYLDKSTKCISTTTVQRRGAICIIVNNPDEDNVYDDNDNDDENNNTNDSDNSDDFDDGASKYSKKKRSKVKKRHTEASTTNDGSTTNRCVSSSSTQVQATKLKCWHNLFMVTQKRKKKKSKKKFKAKSKSYKCQNNYPKTSRKSNKRNGKITKKFIDYFRRSSHDIHQKKKKLGKVSQFCHFYFLLFFSVFSFC